MTLPAQDIGERRVVIRSLLRHPLLTLKRDPELFRLAVRHKPHVVNWFATHTGWSLTIDRHGGFARLFKVPVTQDTSHAATVNQKVFSARHYTLLCLALAALDDCGMQITLARLAERLVELSLDTPQIDAFDPNRLAERRIFVDVLRWLVNASVLMSRDGDAERYASGGDADALYDVDERLLGQLIAAPVAPSLAADAAAMGDDIAYADTEDGRRQRARHAVMRRLLDEPVVYFDELSPRERAWLEHSRGYIFQVLKSDVGLSVERRQEGLACVDPKGTLTDRLFPKADSTLKHAALLLAEKWAARVRDAEPVTPDLDTQSITAMLAGIVQTYAVRCNWNKVYVDEDALPRLTADVLAFLSSLKLVRQRTADVWEARPAIARFAVVQAVSRRTT